MGNDSWDHTDKEWVITLDQARKRGWPEPEKASSHGGSVLNCPVGDPQCRQRIYSTAKGSENVARTARKKIARCPHGNFTAPFDRIDDHLGRAERLLAAAEVEVERTDRENHANELLDLSSVSLGIAEGELAAIEDEYAFVVDEEERLTAHLETLLEGEDPAHSTPGALVDSATSSLRAAGLELRDLPSAHERYATAAERLASARERLESLKRLL